MADEVTKKIIEIEVQGEQTVKGLKEEIASLRDKLLNVKEGSEDYKNVLGQLIEDEKQLTSVMAAGKKEVHAAAGSYNALQQEMTSLKRVWKEVQDEASRNEIGNKINEINNQLKTMDASIGDFHRNVGDYTNSIVDASKLVLKNLDEISPALDGIGGQISSLIPLIQKTVKAATTGLKGVKAALAGTGIGALVLAVGLLISNWDKLTAAVRKFIPSIRESDEATKAQVEDNEKLLEANKETTEQMNHQARLMQAQGKSTKEIIEFKKKETEALLVNTQAQIEENKAKIQSIKEHSAFYRFLHGENKQLRDLEESMKTLVSEQDSLTASLKKLDQDLEVETETIKHNTRAVKENKEEKAKLVDVMKLLEEAERKAEKARQDRLKEQAETDKMIAEMEADLYTELEDFDTSYIDTLIANRQREEQLQKERIESYYSLAGSVESVMGSIADSWESAIQAQVNAGKISEEEAEKQFEGVKALQTAQAVINTIAGVVAALTAPSLQSAGPWGWAAAIAQSVAIAAAGAAQIAKIQSTTIGTKSIGGSVSYDTAAAVNPNAEYSPNYYQNITNATETENLANAISQQPIWVSVKDIDKAQKRVTVVQNESTF